MDQNEQNEQNEQIDKMDNLINRYFQYYKKINPDKVIKNMFDNIDYDDPTSTNHIMEIFYEELLKHNKINNDVYESIEDINIDDVDELYMLEMCDKKYISESVISLLYILSDYNGDWNIINLI
jgi:hypothetical protein